MRAARPAGEVISHGLAAHLHCTASPSRSHCERGSKIRKLPLPNGYSLVYFTGAPEKLYSNVDFRSLCSTCFTQVEWKRVVLFGSRMTDCALPVLSALCHSCPCVRIQCLALQVSKQSISGPFCGSSPSKNVVKGNGRHGIYQLFYTA